MEESKMKIKTEIFKYGVFTLLLMLISILFVNFNTNKDSLETSGTLEL